MNFSFKMRLICGRSGFYLFLILNLVKISESQDEEVNGEISTDGTSYEYYLDDGDLLPGLRRRRKNNSKNKVFLDDL